MALASTAGRSTVPSSLQPPSPLRRRPSSSATSGPVSPSSSKTGDAKMHVDRGQVGRLNPARTNHLQMSLRVCGRCPNHHQHQHHPGKEGFQPSNWERGLPAPPGKEGFQPSNWDRGLPAPPGKEGFQPSNWDRGLPAPPGNEGFQPSPWDRGLPALVEGKMPSFPGGA